MNFKVTRRDFLKSAGTLPALSMLPYWSIPDYSEEVDLFAVDFVWRCSESVEWDKDMLDDCYRNEGWYPIYDGEFPIKVEYGCKRTFLIRKFLWGDKSCQLNHNSEILNQGLKSKNRTISLSCPICNNGWWLEHVATGFEETIFFAEIEEMPDFGGEAVSKVLVPPPEGSCFVREGNEGWFKHMTTPMSSFNLHYKIDELAHGTKIGKYPAHEFQAKYRDLIAQAEILEKRHQYWEKQHRLQWAECNALLPNESLFKV